MPRKPLKQREKMAKRALTVSQQAAVMPDAFHCLVCLGSGVAEQWQEPVAVVAVTVCKKRS